MKKLLTTIILLTIIATLHAQAPELKNMMPNSWQKLTRLSEEEEKEFLAKEEVLAEVIELQESEFEQSDLEKINFQVFTETNLGIQFFRVLMCASPLETIYNKEYKNKILTNEEYFEINPKKDCVWQIVFMKNKNTDLKKILIRSYAEYGTTQGKWDGYIFNDIMIKPLNEKEIGFFITEVGVSFSVDRTRWDEDIVSIKFYTCKDQILGSNSTEFLSVNIQEDFSKAFNDSDRRIRIQASSFLFDSKSPLKYSIQNAFDGNPATSYVENTEDDLMKVIFQYRGQYYVKRIGIINGYAANKNLYNSNSRIFKMKCGALATTTNLYPDPINIEFKDNEMSYQYFDFLSDTHFYVTDIFKGQKYSDTCLAEINLYTNKEYWLFGEVDE